MCSAGEKGLWAAYWRRKLDQNGQNGQICDLKLINTDFQDNFQSNRKLNIQNRNCYRSTGLASIIPIHHMMDEVNATTLTWFLIVFVCSYEMALKQCIYLCTKWDRTDYQSALGCWFFSCKFHSDKILLNSYLTLFSCLTLTSCNQQLNALTHQIFFFRSSVWSCVSSLMSAHVIAIFLLYALLKHSLLLYFNCFKFYLFV